MLLVREWLLCLHECIVLFASVYHILLQYIMFNGKGGYYPGTVHVTRKRVVVMFA